MVAALCEAVPPSSAELCARVARLFVLVRLIKNLPPKAAVGPEREGMLRSRAQSHGRGRIPRRLPDRNVHGTHSRAPFSFERTYWDYANLRALAETGSFAMRSSTYQGTQCRSLSPFMPLNCIPPPLIPDFAFRAAWCEATTKGGVAAVAAQRRAQALREILGSRGIAAPATTARAA